MKSIRRFFSVAIFVVIGGALSQVILPGPCPDVQPMENFDPGRFVGHWAVISGAGEPFYELLVSCDYWEFEGDEGELRRSALHTVIDSTRESMIVRGRLIPLSGPKSADFILHCARTTLYPAAPNFTILDTDYDNWAAMVACGNYGDTHAQYQWITSRKRTLDAEHLRAAVDLVQRNTNLSSSDFYMRNQENCH